MRSESCPRFQSLSRDSGRLNAAAGMVGAVAFILFQSLSRDSGRLNRFIQDKNRMRRKVSIPQSGFGAFERDKYNENNKKDDRVSIPQSGFGAFEPCFGSEIALPILEFQSLSRDSGRLNPVQGHLAGPAVPGFNPSVGIRGV